jgi:transposase
MVWQDLLPRVPGIDLARVEVLGDHVVVHAASTTPVATCPRCGTPSRRVHSRYVRTLTDKPLRGRAVRVLVTVRRFVCSHSPCPRAIFAEAVDDLAPPHARTTAESSRYSRGVTARLSRSGCVPTRKWK